MISSDRKQLSDVLRVGEIIELEVPGSYGKTLYQSRVKGFRDGSVIVTLPLESPELVGATIGFQLCIRKMVDQGILACPAQVLAGSLEPINILSLKQEGEWELHQRRRAVRLSVSLTPLQAFHITPSESKPIDLLILDISAGGMLCESKCHIPIHHRLNVKFQLPGHPTPIETEAEVLRVAVLRESSGSLYRMGARFINLHTREQDRIVKFIFKEQLRRRRMSRQH